MSISDEIRENVKAMEQKRSAGSGSPLKNPICQAEHQEIHEKIYYEKHIYVKFVVHKTPPKPLHDSLTYLE